MCCCCCPAAVNALFCLWCQSGCRQGTVAGALTFFPPEPPLYTFERWTADESRQLQDSEEANVDDVVDDDEKIAITNGSSGSGSSSGDANTTTKKEKHTKDDQDCVEMDAPPRAEPLEGNTGTTAAETKGQTQEQMKSPIQQLTEQAVERRKRAKLRNARDARDAAAGVTYRLALDPRLAVPPYEPQFVQAVKIPHLDRKKKSQNNNSNTINSDLTHVAAVIYRVPHPTPDTRTIIYSHGNATDIGAMFPMQVVLVHALNCNVVMYDYSGYGASGGVPEEACTYADMEAVYHYVLNDATLVPHGDASRIVLYGQSVGSGPCCYLAAKDEEMVGGMILHSAFTSGMRVLTPSRYVLYTREMCCRCVYVWMD